MDTVKIETNQTRVGTHHASHRKSDSLDRAQLTEDAYARQQPQLGGTTTTESTLQATTCFSLLRNTGARALARTNFHDKPSFRSSHPPHRQLARQSTYSSMVYLLSLFSVSKKQRLVYRGLTGRQVEDRLQLDRPSTGAPSPSTPPRLPLPFLPCFPRRRRLN